jgi:septal ring factor EnvC (AmiA/AmiB activator)
MMLRLLSGLAVCLLLSLPLDAQESSIATASQAADALRNAVDALERAGGASDRVSALTATIRAYEQGQAALRDALRSAAIRERELTTALEAKRDRIGQLLGVMSSIEQAPAPLLMLHPSGALGTARSAMILSSVAPALQSEAEVLRGQLQEIADIRALQNNAAQLLQQGLTAAQSARTALSQAMQDRTDLPRRFLEDPEELRALVENVDTLDAFANGIAVMETDVGPPLADFAAAKGTLPLPVLGRVLRRAGEADAAGIRRPGILLATRAGALVTAPWPATIRYRGPLLDYGNVMVLEPAEGYLLVLAGLGVVYGETGDVLPAGAPVGLMPVNAAQETGNTGLAPEGDGAERSETLYMELRLGDTPLDPAEWFKETRDN